MGSLSQVVEAVAQSSERGTYQHQGFTLSSVFQPIYGVRERKAVGFEALLRVRGPGGAPLAPDLFLESFGAEQLVQLDWVARALHLRNFSALDDGTSELYLNVHPAAAVESPADLRAFRDLISFYGVPPTRLCLEILEGQCPDEARLEAAVASYRELGIAIAMDDFGVDRSNFDRVAALQPDLVKVDRSILADAVGDHKARRMLPLVIDLLREAGARTVIEGIEGASEALVAIDSGADYLQGYYFAMPRPDLPDDTLTRRILGELMRMRSTDQPAAAAERMVEPASASAIARLLRTARSLPFATAD